MLVPFKNVQDMLFHICGCKRGFFLLRHVFLNFVLEQCRDVVLQLELKPTMLHIAICDSARACVFLLHNGMQHHFEVSRLQKMLHHPDQHSFFGYKGFCCFCTAALAVFYLL